MQEWGAHKFMQAHVYTKIYLNMRGEKNGTYTEHADSFLLISPRQCNTATISTASTPLEIMSNLEMSYYTPEDVGRFCVNTASFYINLGIRNWSICGSPRTVLLGAEGHLLRVALDCAVSEGVHGRVRLYLVSSQEGSSSTASILLVCPNSSPITHLGCKCLTGSGSIDELEIVMLSKPLGGSGPHRPFTVQCPTLHL